jgi:hypothetical protein
MGDTPRTRGVAQSRSSHADRTGALYDDAMRLGGGSSSGGDWMPQP